MINSDFSCQVFSTPTLSCSGFGVFFVFSSLGKLKGREGQTRKPSAERQSRRRERHPSEEEMKGGCYLTIRVCGCLLSNHLTPSAEPHKIPAGGLGKDKSSHGPEGPTFYSAAASDDLKVGEAQAEIPSRTAALNFCSSFLLPPCGHQGGKEGSQAPTRHRLWPLHPNLCNLPRCALQKEISAVPS